MNATDVALGRTRTAIEALSPVTYLSLGREKLENTMREHPSVAHALWQETAMYSARQQEWAISWGRRAADRRLAHFLCEVAFRLGKSTIKDNAAFEFPLTQRDLADLLGMSAVHVNRCLQKMRKNGLIELKRQTFRIRDRGRMYEIADFDPAYVRC
jgi:CRP-like cAMP-binding protein